MWEAAGKPVVNRYINDYLKKIVEGEQRYPLSQEVLDRVEEILCAAVSDVLAE